MLMCTVAVHAQEPWNRHMGAMINLNTAQMSVSGRYGPTRTTGTQWSAGFGIYMKTKTVNMLRFEVLLAYEVTGAGKTLYYERMSDEWIRIYDRYRTIPVSLILTRSIGWKESWSAGIGGKSSFVVSHTVRHDSEMPGASGIIISPEVRKCFGSGLVQISHHFLYADVSLTGWYAFTPLIDHNGVQVSPYGISFAVKTRLIPDKQQ